MTTTAQTKFTQANGIKMPHREWGTPGAPDLPLLHGWTGRGAAWRGRETRSCRGPIWGRGSKIA